MLSRAGQIPILPDLTQTPLNLTAPAGIDGALPLAGAPGTAHTTGCSTHTPGRRHRPAVGGARSGPTAAREAAAATAAAASTTAAAASVSPDAPPTWKVKLLFDGECPLCVREVNFLKKKDADRGLVSFVDIADPAYDPEANAGLDYATAMGRIHAIEADGTVVQDVRVFRRVYEELGMGWVYAATKVPAVEAVANQVYGVWARARLALTGRGTMEEVMAARGECEDSCRM